MKAKALVLSILCASHIAHADYVRVGDTVQVMKSKGYLFALTEAGYGLGAIFAGAGLYNNAASMNIRTTYLSVGTNISNSGWQGTIKKLCSGALGLSGVVAIGDAIRRCIMPGKVAIEMNQFGLKHCIDGSLIAWEDISSIKVTQFVTVSYGVPQEGTYVVDIDSRTSVPMTINGNMLTVPANTLLSLIRERYKGPITTHKEILQDITPRPTNVYTY